MTKQTVNVNIIVGSAKPVVHVSQYDHDAGALVFNIYDGDTEFSIPPDATIIMQGTKPDKQFFLYQCDGFSGNTVTCSVHDQMTAVAGNVECELRIYSGGNGVGTANFTLSVEHAAVADDSVTSADTLTALSEIENTVIASRDSAASSASAAAKSATQAANDASAATEALAKKGDTLSYADSTLKLLSGETVLSEVTIEGGAAETVSTNLESAINDLSDSVASRTQTKTTVFNSDGSITETLADGRKKNTVFNADGSITETLSKADGTVIWTNKTVFNADGSITETKEA
jgi:hypothetical protein